MPIVISMEHGSGPVYTYNAEVNPKNSSVMIVYLWQGGLGLPDRDYYLRSDNTSRKIQDAYKAHIARVLVLAGEPASEAGADAETIYAMEKDFAASHFSSEACQDPQKTTNLYDPAKLEEQYPAIGWQQLFAIQGSGPVNVVDVSQPSYVQELDKMLRTAPLEDWKVYLKYRLLDDASPYLDTSFEQEYFAFYSTTLNGIDEMQPRWKRVVDAENDLLGNAVGQAYVARYVDPRTRGMYPIPGHEKMVSTKTLPVMIAAHSNVVIVTMGSSAFFNAWRQRMLCSSRPFARAVVM